MGETRSLYARSNRSAARWPGDKSACGIGGAWQTGGATGEGAAEIRFKAGISGFEELAPGDDHDVDAVASGQRFEPPKHLTYQSFSSISPDRVAQLS